jgi:hypothetical protein
MIPLPSDNLRKAREAIIADVVPQSSSPNGKNSRKEIMLNELENNGLSVSDIARNLSNLANFSSDDNMRLRANETASKFYGLLNDDAQKSTTINIIVDGDANIAAICTPKG